MKARLLGVGIGLAAAGGFAAASSYDTMLGLVAVILCGVITAGLPVD